MTPPPSNESAAPQAGVDGAELLAFLSDRGSYAYQPSEVRVVQTHISFAAIADPYVFKVKKPVNFGFVDFSTLDKRRHYTRREVELNRRLSPDVYLGVVPIVFRDGALCFAEGESGDDAVEFAVKMRKLDERFFLQELLAAGGVAAADVDRIVATLTPFYLAQRPGDEVARHGSVDNVRRVVVGNLDDVSGFVGGPVLPKPTYDALRLFCERFLETRKRLLQERVARGWIKDCHGDLRPEHIHLAPDRVSIYDCIEFNDAFRYIDVAADVAFLAMELDFVGRSDLARRFVERIAQECRDDDMMKLMRFYQSYRAAVRGKVGALTAESPQLAADKREATRKKARDYYRLALTYAVAGLRPMVLVVMGRIGTGKSTVAEALADALGWAVFSSDRIRKELGGVPATDRTPPEARRKLYTSSMSEKTYRTLWRRGEERLRAGQSVILDATFGSVGYRKGLRDRLDPLGVPYRFIELDCSDEVIRNRLHGREAQPDVVSDARLEDFNPLGRAYRPPHELPSDLRLKMDGALPIDETLARIYADCIGRGLE